MLDEAGRARINIYMYQGTDGSEKDEKEIGKTMRPPQVHTCIHKGEKGKVLRICDNGERLRYVSKRA